MGKQLIEKKTERELQKIFSELGIEAQEYLIQTAKTTQFVEHIIKKKYEHPKQPA